MLEIHVAPVNGDFSTITEAIQAVPYGEEAVIRIGEGTYREKIFSEKKNISFIGEGPGKTVLEYGDGAFDEMADGSKRGTFRSYTAFLGGERCVVKDMTIRNTAGDGRTAGQALAVYADARECIFENVDLEGCQDTLFMAPLPMTERQKNGFMGPRVMTERVLTKQYYKNCRITGDVDFIFGGADAVFDDCDITCNNRNEEINGYITAPCGLSGNIGMIFRNCRIHGAAGCSDNSVFLGRPWRDEAKAVFLSCTMDKAIAPERFSGWGAISKDQPDTFFGEYGSVTANGDIIDLSHKNPWVKEIDESTARELGSKADFIITKCLSL
ncbi:pectinesterase family protein [Butyrivibrio sp. AE3009]|uniref:pectinesterase family protein n=1 Tax=Butyrivibrio sp. AE3009 TaxID=1280666 RepID=UPI0003B57AB5|nr:pectinesterase family protein [Butyrivibrio sp. AE3009]